MQLAAGRWTVGEQRFQKLHAGCDDDRGIPVFGKQSPSALHAIHTVLFSGFSTHPGHAMVFQDIIIAKFVFKQVAIDTGGLFDDGEIGNDHHHSAQPMFMGMFQCKGEHAQCLTAAGRGSQREKTGLCVCRSQAVTQ